LRGWIDNTIDNTLVSPQQIKRKRHASCFSLAVEGGQYAGPHSNGLLSNKKCRDVSIAAFSRFKDCGVTRFGRCGLRYTVVLYANGVA
jgi:hypothetical protein